MEEKFIINKGKSLWIKFQRASTLLIIIFAIGFYCGQLYTNKTNNDLREEAINLKAMSYLDSNYQITYLGPRLRFDNSRQNKVSSPVIPSETGEKK
jgi:hypothetical protein